MKYKFYKKGEDKLDDMLEITYMLKKFEEVEKLKGILLNKPQLSVFHMLSKELCCISSEGIKNSEYTKIKNLQKHRSGLNEEIEKFRNKILDEVIINF